MKIIGRFIEVLSIREYDNFEGALEIAIVTKKFANSANIISSFSRKHLCRKRKKNR